MWGKHAQNADKAAREADTHVKRTESRGGKDAAGRVERAVKRQVAEDLREAAKSQHRSKR